MFISGAKKDHVFGYVFYYLLIYLRRVPVFFQMSTYSVIVTDQVNVNYGPNC